MTYYPNESVGLAHPVGAEGMTFQCGDSVACHAEPPTCGCVTCPDCGSNNLTGPDHEGMYDCLGCGAAWIPERGNA